MIQIYDFRVFTDIVLEANIYIYTWYNGDCNWKK